MASRQVLNTKRFNHDIVVDEEGQRVVGAVFPQVAHVAYNPAVVAAFKPQNDLGVRLKGLVYALGSMAILLLVVALCVDLLELWDHGGEEKIVEHWLGYFGEFAAIFGLFLALFASRFGLRRKWLKARFVAEIIRQWHFRRFLCGSDIDASIRSPIGKQDYVDSAARQLDAFLSKIRGSEGEVMDRFRQDGVDPLGPIPIPELPTQPQARQAVLNAYKQLRLDFQAQHMTYKLSPDDKTFCGVSLVAFVETTSVLAGFTLIAALVSSSVQVISPDLEWLSLLSAKLAVLGVAVRALRDGMSLDAQFQDYLGARDVFDQLETRWVSASSDDERFALARAVEEQATSELRAFLRSHENAQFLF